MKTPLLPSFSLVRPERFPRRTRVEIAPGIRDSRVTEILNGSRNVEVALANEHGLPLSPTVVIAEDVFTNTEHTIPDHKIAELVEQHEYMPAEQVAATANEQSSTNAPTASLDEAAAARAAVDKIFADSEKDAA